MPPIEFSDEILTSLQPNGRQQEFYDAGFRLPGSFGMRVGGGGRRAFFLIYVQDGVRQRLPLGVFPLVSLDDARRRAEEVLRSVSRGENPAFELRARRRAPTLSHLAREYIGQQQEEKKLLPATRREYARVFHRDILPMLGQKKIIDIDESDSDQLFREIADRRGSRTMAERSCALLKAALRYAAQSGQIGTSKLADWRPPETAQPVRPKQELSRQPFSDILRLWVLLGEEDPLVAGPFRIILLTAQRPADVLRMRWSQIRGELWHIPSRDRSGDGISVPFFLTPPAVLSLKLIQERTKRRKIDSSPFVFPSRDGGPKRHLRKTAFRLSQKLGLRRPFSPLSLRHTVRENLYELGIRPDVIERLLSPHLQTRIRRNSLESTAYNYSEEIKQALLAWSRRLTTVTPLKPFGAHPPSRTGLKVVPLFPGKDPKPPDK